nr:soluble scavenger receptor cysteine-rich domain-containing protein SSC5D-like [Anolis sagrei ordinatus]
MEQVNCTGKENVLKKCPQEKSLNLTCDHRKDAGVECAELRLVNGSSNCSGMVEVFHNETWGTICNAGWDLKDAQVVCRELGCGKALSASGGARLGRGTGPIWLQQMNCTGKEDFLRQCPKGQWGEHSCNHSRDASVECAGVMPISGPRKIRLVNGFSRCSGRIEVFHNQEWGILCDLKWDLNDARVLCRELECGDVISVPWGVRFERTNSPVWLLSFHCKGTENALSDCKKRPTSGVPQCHHGEGAGVVCSGNV